MAQIMTRTFNLINTNNKNLKDISSISSNKASSFEDSDVTRQSYSDDSFVIDNHQIRRDNHYIKHSKSNRNDDHITSLKRRIRKQHLRHDQSQVTTFQLPLSSDLFLISHSQQSVTPCYN